MPAFIYSGLSTSEASQLASHEYGTIFVQDGSTPQGSLGTTPVKVTGFAGNGPSSSGITPDHTNDQITIGVSGVYWVGLQVSFSGSPSAIFEVHLRDNGNEQPEGFHRKLSSGGDVGSASFFAVRMFNAGDVLTIFVETDSGLQADTWTPIDMQFSVFSLPQDT